MRPVRYISAEDLRADSFMRLYNIKGARHMDIPAPPLQFPHSALHAHALALGTDWSESEFLDTPSQRVFISP